MLCFLYSNFFVKKQQFFLNIFGFRFSFFWLFFVLICNDINVYEHTAGDGVSKSIDFYELYESRDHTGCPVTEVKLKNFPPGAFPTITANATATTTTTTTTTTTLLHSLTHSFSIN